MRTPILPALLLVALPTFAAAAVLTFEEVDTDGDGLISADEAASVEGLDFNTADSDNDGTLSVDEYDIAVESLPPPATAQPPVEPAPPVPPPAAAVPAPPTPSPQSLKP